MGIDFTRWGFYQPSTDKEEGGGGDVMGNALLPSRESKNKDRDGLYQPSGKWREREEGGGNAM